MADKLGDRIRGRRQRKGWTLKNLADATGLSLPYLSDLERRPGVNPTLEALTRVADALDCKVADLVDDATGMTAGSTSPSGALARFFKSEEFNREVQRVAERTQRDPDEVQAEVTQFLMVAPKRSSGELSETDWRRLLDAYRMIQDG